MAFGGSDLWDNVRPQSNLDSDGTRWVPLSVPSDRRHGANWPLWRTHVDLDRLRQESRLRCASNSFAQGLLRNLLNNTIGKGCTYKARPLEPLVDTDPETPGIQDPRDQLAEQVQKIIDRFLKRNNWNGTIDPRGNLIMAGSREREIYRRVKRDGESFLRFHGQDDGTMLVRFIEPEQIRDQGGALWTEGWTFGIRHRMDPFEDVECAEEYSVFWQDPTAKGGLGETTEDHGTYELVDASEILHLKGPDTDSTIKRGTPDFVYETGKALDRAAGLQKAVSMAARIRASTAEIWQHNVGTQSQVLGLAQGLSSFQRTDPVTGQTEFIEKIGPGAIRRIPKDQELVPNPPDQSQSYLAAGQGDLRQAAAAHCAPEFWMAETSSGNYSNLESAAAPAVRMGQCEQEYYKAAFARCVWKAIEWAIECGQLPRDVVEQITIDVDAPAVLHRNELEKAQEDQILIGLGVKDRQTAAAERGLDWDTISQNNQEYQEQMGPQDGGGLPMPGPDGGFGGGAGGDPMAGGITEGLLEAVLRDKGIHRLTALGQYLLESGQWNLLEDSIYHGPVAPGPGWVQVGVGKRGGKLWSPKPKEGGGGLLGMLGMGKKNPAAAAEPKMDREETTTQVLAQRMADSKAYQDRAKEISTKQQVRWEYAAQEAGKSVSEYKDHIEKKAQAFCDAQEVYMRLPNDLLGAVLESGRIKNQFETGFARGGAYAPKMRARDEEVGMGVPKDAEGVSRPISCYMGPKDFGGLHNDPCRQYGSIMIKMKPAVRERSTVTFGDSLALISQKEASATPLGQVGHMSLDPGYLTAYGDSVFDDADTWLQKTNRYVEVQVHDGLPIEDIEEISFEGGPPDEKIQKILEEKGIKWGTHDRGGQRTTLDRKGQRLPSVAEGRAAGYRRRGTKRKGGR